MNRAVDRHDFDEEEQDYRVDIGRNQPSKTRNNFQYRATRSSSRRTAPTIYNGIHRRRQRRIMW